MSRATLDYLNALQEPETFISSLARKAVDTFASEQLKAVLSHAKRDESGQQYIEPIKLISRRELVDLNAQLGIDHDMDLAELYALGVMNSHNRGLDGWYSPTCLLVRRAVTSRVHTLMEARPELFHPNLRVAKSAADEGDVWMLRFLVQHSVALNPERLLHLARRPGPVGDVLQKAIQEGKSYGAPILEEALKMGRGCASTATALVLADIQPPELDEYQMQHLWTMCAAGVAGAQWQFDQAMQLLRSIRQRQDEAGGDGCRISWPQGRELLERVNCSWSTARGAHPTMGLIYETTLRAAYIGHLRHSDVAGFPGLPLEAAAASLNAVLEPEFRLELAELSPGNLVKLGVLCPKASGTSVVRSFWHRDPSGWNANNPSELLNWAATRSDSSGEPLDLQLLDSLATDLTDVLSPTHFNALRALVTNQVMNRAIKATTEATSVQEEAAWAAPSAPAAHRRARMV